MKSLILVGLIYFSIQGFAVEAKKRIPASDSAIVTVKAEDLPQAMKKFASHSTVSKIIQAGKDTYKECDGTLGEFDAKSAMKFYTGKSSVTEHFVGYLVPIYGGCSGTGMIEEASLLAKVGVNINLEKKSENYSLFGFVKVKTLKPSEADQSSGLSEL